jgi:hypothetical protein
MSPNYKKQCICCGKYNSATRFPYGSAWLCYCGCWNAEIFIDGIAEYFSTGDEERVFDCIERLVKIMEENDYV